MGKPDLSLWRVRGFGYRATVRGKEQTVRTHPGREEAIMPDRSSPIRHTAFTETESAALQALRARHCTISGLFTDRELAHLRFLRWLVHQPASRHAREKPLRAEAVPLDPVAEPAMGDRISRLKAAYDAGYSGR